LNMECKDRNCPTHGTLSTRGTQLEGEVVSDKMQGTVIVLRDRLVKVKKYDRYRKKTSRIPAHNPPCIGARQGDIVRVMECRKLSKTVSFVVIEKLKGNEAEEAKPRIQKAPIEKAAPKAEAKKKAAAPKKAKKKEEVENG
jgi:small subunit ribosomal protein S17